MVALGERAETPASPSNDDFETQVRQAQAELVESVDRAGLSRDPYRFAVAAIVHTLGVFPAIVRRLENAGNPAVLERVEASAANGAAQRAAELAGAYNRRTVLLTGAVFVVGIVIAAFGGYQAGRSSAFGNVSAVQAAAVRDGPDAAALWAQLMTANDGRLVAQVCKETGARSEGGRRACALGLWTDPPTNSIPRTSPASK